MTLEDIGHEVGVTRERVRQIESKTLAMLKSLGRSGPPGGNGRRGLVFVSLRRVPPSANNRSGRYPRPSRSPVM